MVMDIEFCCMNNKAGKALQVEGTNIYPEYMVTRYYILHFSSLRSFSEGSCCRFLAGFLCVLRPMKESVMDFTDGIFRQQ